MSNEIVKVETDSGVVDLSPNIVRQTISGNPQVTDREVEFFIQLCKAQHLNPFIKEAHLIKYGDMPATMVVGKDVFTKRAQKNPKYQGMQAGISFNVNGKLARREGSMLLPGEQILGGWCKVYVEGYREPIYDEVSFSEYAGRKKDGTLNSQWASKPGTMIRKVALVHALREAFPDDFAGLYDEAEMANAIAEPEPIEVIVEPTPQQIAWKEVSDLKAQAIELGIKEEGINSWVETTFQNRDKKTLSVEEIRSISDYIHARIEDMKIVSASCVATEEDYVEPELFDEEVEF